MVIELSIASNDGRPPQGRQLFVSPIRRHEVRLWDGKVYGSTIPHKFSTIKFSLFLHEYVVQLTNHTYNISVPTFGPDSRGIDHVHAAVYEMAEPSGVTTHLWIFDDSHCSGDNTPTARPLQIQRCKGTVISPNTMMHLGVASIWQELFSQVFPWTFFPNTDH